MTIYREQEGLVAAVPGQAINLRQPRSWSATEKVVMGETTFIAKTKYGTNVSVLSQYIGESEVISYNPKGYKVVRVENRSFGERQTRHIVYLTDAPA